MWELSNHPALGTLGGLSKEPSGVEGPLTFGPGPGLPFLGLPWIGWDFLAQGHPVGASLPASSPAQRERGQLRGHTFWAGSRGGDEFRELRHHSRLLGPLASVVALGMDSEEKARRPLSGPGLHRAAVTLQQFWLRACE